jgi:hypothetical protein
MLVSTTLDCIRLPLSNRKVAVVGIPRIIRRNGNVVAFAAVLLLVSASTGTAQSETRTFDAGQFNTIPAGVIVSDMASEYNLRLFVREMAEHHTYREAYLAALAKIDSDVRRMVLLEFLREQSGRGAEPDGLHTYFFLEGGDVAPEVAEALREAGMERQYRAFSEAMALFGPNYPLTRVEREKNFAWSQPGTRIDNVTTIPQPLNAFDHKLLDISEQFGTRRQFEQAIDSYVAANPFLMERVDRARDRLSIRTRLDWLTGKLQSRVDLWHSPAELLRSLAALPKPYRTLAVVSIFWDEYYNGGVEQFFFNNSGAVAPDVAAGLRELGLARDADVLDKAISLFPAPYPVDTRLRRALLAQHKDWDEMLEKLSAPEAEHGAVTQAMVDLAVSEGILPR